MSRRARVLATAAASICVLGSLYFVRAALTPGKVLAHVPDAAVSCVEPLLDASRSCIEGCGMQSMLCRFDCMATLNDALEGCEKLPKLDRTGMQLLWGEGKGPGWALVRDKLLTPIEALAKCNENRGTFTARIVVSPDSRVFNVAVGSHQRDVAECIAEHLQKFDAPQLGFGPYAFLVRAQPPEGLPMAPPDEPDGAPKFIPWPVIEPGAPEEVRSTQVLDADWQELQAALEHARAVCTPKPERSCAPTIQALSSHFAKLPVSYSSEQAPVRRYQLNNLDGGFDCVRVEAAKGFARNTSLLIARQAQLLASNYVLVSPEELAVFPNPDVAADSHRLAGFRNELVHLHNVQTTELSVCFSFEKSGSSQWLLGLASYPGDTYAWQFADIRAFGLSKGVADSSKLKDAISKRDYIEVKRLLAAGVKLDGIHGPLAIATRAQWIPEKLELLRQAGAKPNELDDDGNSAVHNAAWYYRKQSRAIEALKHLKWAGADLDLMLDSGTALHLIAQCSNRRKVWRALIEMGANPHLKNRYGLTAMYLHCVCLMGPHAYEFLRDDKVDEGPDE